MDIVTRAEWGANYTSAFYRVGMDEKAHFFVHYHGGKPAHQYGKAVPREVEDIHHANGWSGVGYSWVVDLDGVIYEGRGWDGVAVACPGYNRSGIHVYVAVGDDQEPTLAAYQAVLTIRDEHRRRRAAIGRSAPQEWVHGDKYATSCAGPVLTPWVHAGMPAPDSIGDDMLTLDKINDLLNEKLAVRFTERQKDLIGTGQDVWPMGKAVAYLAGQVAYARRLAYAVKAVAETAAEDAAVARALAEAQAAKGGSALSADDVAEATRKGLAKALAQAAKDLGEEPGVEPDAPAAA